MDSSSATPIPTTLAAILSGEPAAPLESLPSPWQPTTPTTAVVYALRGSEVWEGGICCLGGVVGDVIRVWVDFDAMSPYANVTEMRVGVGGICFTESQLADMIWEPYVLSKTYFLPVHMNWIGHYVSVQYRDDLNNLSPVYCDDIGFEGSPPPPTSIP